ncbi:hypothetical protein D3C79_652030 [compost metagenome]
MPVTVAHGVAHQVLQGTSGQTWIKDKAWQIGVGTHLPLDAAAIKLFGKAAKDTVDQLQQRHFDPFTGLIGVLQAAIGQQFEHQFVQLAHVPDQFQQAFAAMGRNFVEQQHQTKIKPGQWRA